MSGFLKQGDTIVVSEETPLEKGVTEGSVRTVKILKNLTMELMDLFRTQKRSQEGFLQFIIRSGIGRAIVPKQTYVYNLKTGAVTTPE